MGVSIEDFLRCLHSLRMDLVRFSVNAPHWAHPHPTMSKDSETVTRRGLLREKYVNMNRLLFTHIINAGLHQTFLGLVMFSHPNPILWRF